MNKNEKFMHFLVSLSNETNKGLLETIAQGYSACFESLVKYFGIDPFTGDKKEYYKLHEDIPLRQFDKEEALTQLIELWSKREPTDEQLEFLLAKKPEVEIGNYRFFLTNHDGWNTLRKFANNVFPERLAEIKKVKQETADITLRNRLRQQKVKGNLIDPKLMNIENKLKERKMERLSQGLKEFAGRELASA